jgi:[ribosomal protein S5]-alanine N-acetyltransferase
VIKLILLGNGLLAALAEDPVAALKGFSSNGTLVAPVARKVATATLALQAKTGATPPWAGYLALRDGDHAVVGACAFRGPPAAGAVEIVCFTFPGFERQGFGTAMAGQLIEIAFARDAVSEVIAHTPPEECAATRVLRRHGFDFHGVAFDKRGDEISRWTLRRPGTVPH